MSLVIRPIEARDCAAIAAFLEPYTRDTVVSFSAVMKTAEGLEKLFAERARAGRGNLLAEWDGQPAGYVSYDQFRANDGYRRTMEHTVMLALGMEGRGMGRALMAAIEDHARAAGNHVMVGAISAENTGSITFHEAIGYQVVGRMPEIGRKFDRWLDLVIVQKLL